MAKIVNTYIDEETGHEMAEYESGAIRDVTRNRIVRAPDKYLITKENAAEMVARKKQIFLREYLIGLAKATGEVLPDDDLDEITQKAGSTVQAVTIHSVKTYLASKNLRGMAEMWTKLFGPLAGEKEQDDTPEKVGILEALGREAVEHLLKRAKEIREEEARWG